jgi:hypothetical protein
LNTQDVIATQRAIVLQIQILLDDALATRSDTTYPSPKYLNSISETLAQNVQVLESLIRLASPTTETTAPATQRIPNPTFTPDENFG